MSSECCKGANAAKITSHLQHSTLHNRGPPRQSISSGDFLTWMSCGFFSLQESQSMVCSCAHTCSRGHASLCVSARAFPRVLCPGLSREGLVAGGREEEDGHDVRCSWPCLYHPTARHLPSRSVLSELLSGFLLLERVGSPFKGSSDSTPHKPGDSFHVAY